MLVLPFKNVNVKIVYCPLKQKFKFKVIIYSNLTSILDINRSKM